MGKMAKIAPIKKEYNSSFLTIDNALAKNGFTRAPGTYEMLLPYKEASGRYRTGLDPKAGYLMKMSKEDREAEVKRINEDKSRLESELGCTGCLDPTSDFYNFSSNAKIKVSPVKLGNDDQFIDLSSPMGEITWNWLKHNPRLASSLDAYKRGEVPSDVKYYIVDDDAETKDMYSKKKEINRAIAAFDGLNPSKRKQIARLMGLPVTDDTKEEIVYNLVDSALKDPELRGGGNKGMRPVALFNELLKMKDDRIKVKDLVEQAIVHSIYRVGQGGKITEGGSTIAVNQDELVEFLLDEKNQMDLIALDKKLNAKKIDSL